MNILSIANKITKFIESIRVPIIPIPAILLLCTVLKRGGASPMIAAANIIRRQPEFGAPSGLLPDGSPNKMNALIYVMTSEIMRELKENCVIESVIPPGSMLITATGANGGGPVTCIGTNTTPTKSTGIIR